MTLSLKKENFKLLGEFILGESVILTLKVGRDLKNSIFQWHGI